MKALMKGLLVSSLFLAVGTQVYAADSKAGEAKAAVCAGCHGEKGISKTAQYPNLAGQQAMYIANQLRAFQSGSRDNAMMKGMAAQLSEADMDNLAAYYASLPNTTAYNADAKISADAVSKANMCIGCHGSKAEGRGGFPRLANQHPDYIVQQLQAFKDKKREGGPMSGIAASLSTEDIKALSIYLSNGAKN